MTFIDIKGLMGVILLSLQDLITFATETEPRDLNIHIMPDRNSWYILSNYFQQSVPPLCFCSVIAGKLPVQTYHWKSERSFSDYMIVHYMTLCV